MRCCPSPAGNGGRIAAGAVVALFVVSSCVAAVHPPGHVRRPEEVSELVARGRLSAPSLQSCASTAPESCLDCGRCTAIRLRGGGGDEARGRSSGRGEGARSRDGFDKSPLDASTSGGDGGRAGSDRRSTSAWGSRSSRGGRGGRHEGAPHEQGKEGVGPLARPDVPAPGERDREGEQDGRRRERGPVQHREDGHEVGREGRRGGRSGRGGQADRQRRGGRGDGQTVFGAAEHRRRGEESRWIDRNVAGEREGAGKGQGIAAAPKVLPPPHQWPPARFGEGTLEKDSHVGPTSVTSVGSSTGSSSSRTGEKGAVPSTADKPWRPPPPLASAVPSASLGSAAVQPSAPPAAGADGGRSGGGGSSAAGDGRDRRATGGASMPAVHPSRSANFQRPPDKPWQREGGRDREVDKGRGSREGESDTGRGGERGTIPAWAGARDSGRRRAGAVMAGADRPVDPRWTDSGVWGGGGGGGGGGGTGGAGGAGGWRARNGAGGRDDEQLRRRDGARDASGRGSWGSGSGRDRGGRGVGQRGAARKSDRELSRDEGGGRCSQGGEDEEEGGRGSQDGEDESDDDSDWSADYEQCIDEAAVQKAQILEKSVDSDFIQWMC
jgi:hypothetical protein